MIFEVSATCPLNKSFRFAIASFLVVDDVDLGTIVDPKANEGNSRVFFGCKAKVDVFATNVFVVFSIVFIGTIFWWLGFEMLQVVLIASTFATDRFVLATAAIFDFIRIPKEDIYIHTYTFCQFECAMLAYVLALVSIFEMQLYHVDFYNQIWTPFDQSFVGGSP